MNVIFKVVLILQIVTKIDTDSATPDRAIGGVHMRFNRAKQVHAHMDTVAANGHKTEDEIKASAYLKPVQDSFPFRSPIAGVSWSVGIVIGQCLCKIRPIRQFSWLSKNIDSLVFLNEVI